MTLACIHSFFSLYTNKKYDNSMKLLNFINIYLSEDLNNGPSNLLIKIHTQLFHLLRFLHILQRTVVYTCSDDVILMLTTQWKKTVLIRTIQTPTGMDQTTVCSPPCFDNDIVDSSGGLLER